MKFGLWALVALLSISCGGTGTGNPTSNGNIAEIQAEPIILDPLCDKLVECFSDLIETECRLGLAAVSNIDTEIGLNLSQFATLEDIITAEAAGTIVANQQNYEVCKDDIEALACDDASVVAAWDSSDPDNFDSVAFMIPSGSGSCPDIFPDLVDLYE